MKLSLDRRGLTEVRTDALIVGRRHGESRLSQALAALDGKLGGLLAKVMTAEKFEGKPGQLTQLHTDGKLPAARVLVVGLGSDKGDAEAVRRAASLGARRARELGAKNAAAHFPADGL